MFRPGTTPNKKERVNLNVTGGGLGDLLCYLVVVDYILTTIKWVDPIIYVPDYLLEFAVNVLPKHGNIKNYSYAIDHYNDKLTGLSTAWSGQHSAMRIHPIDYAAHLLIDADLPIEKKNYLKFDISQYDLTKFNLPDKYITISVGSTARVKELPATILNKIIDYVISIGYIPVFIGKTEELQGGGPGGLKAKLAKIDYHKGIDLTNQTSICETTAIISKAELHTGMEGGLVHLAGFTDTPIVAAYSFVNPEVMSPIRNNQLAWKCYPIIPEESLACRFCQSNIPLLYGHNYQECYYSDYACINQLTFKKFKEQIDQALHIRDIILPDQTSALKYIKDNNLK